MANEHANYERFDWNAKLNSMHPGDSQKWQIKEYHKVVSPGDSGIDGMVYWFNQYVWTIDPRETPALIPFMVYDYQIDLLKQLATFTDTFIDKSRQMGISWTIMGFELYHVLYRKGFNCLNISRKESEVQDRGNTFNSLHGRLKFMYDRLPPYIKPRVHNPFLTFSVPSMNSVIKGESSNPKAGRDSQYKMIFIDEAAHIECLDEMWKGCRSASNGIVLNSTPPKSKLNNKFAEIKEMKNSGFTKMKFHWKQHPKYTDEWYRKKTASMTEQEIAQELEINYDAALTDVSYPEYSDDKHLMNYKVRVNNKSKLYCFMDFGLNGEVFLFAQKDYENRLFFIHYRIFFNKLTGELYFEMLKCLGRMGYTGDLGDIIYIGDRSGNRRDRTSKISVIDEYKKVSKGKIKIRTKEVSNDDKMKNMKACLKRRINGKPQFNISKEDTCIKFAEAMKSLQMNKAGTDHLDNKYTHVVNAAEYGVNYLFPRKKEEFALVSIDPGQKISNSKDEDDVRVVESNIRRAPCATAVIGNYRTPRKGVIL